MLAALDGGHLGGAASDCGAIAVGDISNPLFQQLAAHPKVLVTPDMSCATTQSLRQGNDIMIDKVAAWLAGTHRMSAPEQATVI